MKTQVLVNVEVPEEKIAVVHGLRQGWMVAPTLVNLYACIVAERWRERLERYEGMGICLYHKVDGKLFGRYTKSSLREVLTEWQFRGTPSCLLYTSPSPRDATLSRMPSSA